jgi:hypothetical protein
MTTTLDKENKLYAVVPATFRIAPNKIKLPNQMTYVLHHVATDSVTGDALFIVTSDKPEGIQDFLTDFENPRTVNNLKKLSKRGDWKMNMFPEFDDGESDFEDIIRKGVESMERAATDRAYRKNATARVRVLEEREKEQRRAAVAMYERNNQ